MSPTILDEPESLRHAGPADLACSWTDTRARLLRLWEAWQAALPPAMEVRYAPELNPPRWEFGHVGWFEEWWIARNPQRRRGAAADPDTPRAASLLPGADALYDSSQVAHTRRWHLPLPDAARSRRYVAQVHERTSALLDQAADDDASMYFFRLAHAHEQMHLEAWIYMAQHLALPIAAALEATRPAPAGAEGELSFAAQTFELGSRPGGLVFDNELQAHAVDLATFAIDRTPVTWARFLPFVEAGGYEDPRWWSADGWAWRQRQGLLRPRHVVVDDGQWRQACFGEWLAIDPRRPAVHLSCHEAEAWCRWAGRRLPTEAEWECAALGAGTAFERGEVWEWTASPFAPYPGFEPHPYRDYSRPWFDGRPVLRGGSFATRPGLKHPRYRNYFAAERNDLFAGFRSCAV